MKRVLALVLFVSACGGSAKPTPSAAPPASTAETAPAATPAAAPAPPAAEEPPPANAACNGQAAQLGTQLRGWADAQPGFLPMVQGIKTPVTKAAKAVDKRGVVIAVTKDGSFYIQGAKLAAAEVREYLDAMWKLNAEKVAMADLPPDDKTLNVYVWADRDAPISAVATVVAATEPEKPSKSSKSDPPPPEDEGGSGTAMALDEGNPKGGAGKAGGAAKKVAPPVWYRVRLLVTGSADAPAVSSDPTPTGLTLPASEPDSTKYVVEQIKTGIGSCQPIIYTLGTYSSEGMPSKEADKLVSDVPAGLQKCGCKVGDPDKLTWGLRTWFGGWAPKLQWIDMPKLKATDKRTVGKLVK